MIRRVVIAAGGAIAVFVAFPVVALAHPVGGRFDLPVPLAFFMVGAGIALLVSFVLLALLWPEPRLQELGPGKQLSGAWVGPLRVFLGFVGLLGLFLVIATGLSSGRTIGPASIVFIHFWVTVPVIASIFGNWWLALSPWRTVGNWIAPPTTDAEPGRSLGLWPAAGLFLAFTWLELVFVNSGDPRILAYLALAYTVLLLAAMSWFGVTPGLRQWGFMENYSRLVGAISPIEWRVEEGVVKLTRRSWLRALPSLPAEPGFVGFVVLMLGTVTYDGVSGTEWWRDLFPDRTNDQVFGTVALVLVTLAIGLGYLAACWAAARLAESDLTAYSVARSFAHTLVPIAFAYAFAHYFTLVLLEGQLLISAVSDPFDRGWNLIGTADRGVVFWSWLTPTVVWYVQVAAIVLGHIAGVILAHDRAVAVFSSGRAARSQYAMLGLMIGLTGLGLFVLSG